MIRWRHKLRLLVVLFVLLLLFGGLGVRLYYLQIIKHHFFTAYASKRHLSTAVLYPVRGTVFDRTGQKILAQTRRTKSVFVNPAIINDPQKTKDPERVFIALSEILQLDIEKVRMRGTTKTTKGSFAGEVLLERKPDIDKIQKIEELIKDKSFFLGSTQETNKKSNSYIYSGIYFKERHERLYPSDSLLCHVLGFMQDEDPAGIDIIRDDIKPQRGIELSLDKDLKGMEGLRTAEVDKIGRAVISDKTREKPVVNGYNAILTIDQNIQFAVEKEINEAAKKVKFDSCSAIVMDPNTGEILAMANYPGFNPNKITEFTDVIIANHAIETVYEPGSTLKPITGCIALEMGIVTMDMQFDCEGGVWHIPGGPLHDAHEYRILTFREIIEKSSNIGIAKVALLIGEEGVYENLVNFGFNQKTGINIGEEKSGFLQQVNKWSKRSIYMLPMGQEISVTSLQLANAFCVIANGGNLMKPILVQRIEDENQIIIQEFKPEVVRKVISKKTTDNMKIALSDVVSESGTARLADIKGYTEAGKTGTAQKVVEGRYSDRIFDSSFVGFAPAENPRIVILVCMNGTIKPNHFGGTVVGPVFARIGESVLKYLEVPYDAPEELEKVEKDD